ncbi:inner membrane-spanning protein YciB [Sphingomonas sp. MMS24-JH45]
MPAEVARRIVDGFTGTLSGMGRLEALLMARVIVATAVFVIASAIALVIARTKRRVPPMLLISAALVIVFGGLTMYFRDPRFIQMKPTIVYFIMAATLGFGLATNSPAAGDGARHGLSGVVGARLASLTVNWTVFFAIMAVLNEAVRRGAGTALGETRGWDLWAIYKVWVVIPATFIFAEPYLADADAARTEARRRRAGGATGGVTNILRHGEGDRSRSEWWRVASQHIARGKPPPACGGSPWRRT